MAFARAEAAGFDMDKLVDLISFVECFGASRLKEACIGLRELWKKKHDTGQWLEVEAAAAAAMSIHPEFSTLNASGIVFDAESMTQKDYVDPHPLSGGDMVLDIDGKSDKHLPEDVQVPVGHQEHFHGQFQHPTYPQWPLPPPPGHPGFQSESESQFTSESEGEDVQSDLRESKHKHFAETSKKLVGQIKTAQYSDAYSNDKAADGGETDSGN